MGLLAQLNTPQEDAAILFDNFLRFLAMYNTDEEVWKELLPRLRRLAEQEQGDILRRGLFAFIECLHDAKDES